MLKLDHLTVIAPELAEGVAHVRECLDLDIPFGQRHPYMGTHNHLLQLGGAVYLEIVAIDPQADPPRRPRWFGLDDRQGVRRDWDAGQRLRGWVARTDDMEKVLRGREATFGAKVALPFEAPSFDFAIPEDGSLPLGGALPSLIDRRGRPRSMAGIADLGARLLSFSVAYPDSDALLSQLRDLDIDHPPSVTAGAALRYRARIETSAGVKTLW
ncbi:VOC family protein [Roseomonas sp. F4]